MGVREAMGVGVEARQPAMITRNRSAKDVPGRKLCACLPRRLRQRGLKRSHLVLVGEIEVLVGTTRRQAASWSSRTNPCCIR